MEADTFELIQFSSIDKKSFTIGNRFSHFTIFDRDSHLTLQFCCNENGDYNNSVIEVIPVEYLKDFRKCLEAFENKNIDSLRSFDKDIEIEFGYDITDKIEIFFTLVDYDYDATKGSQPQYYTVDVDTGLDGYRTFEELITFLKKYKEHVEKEVKRDEHQSDTIEYQRACRL